MLPAIFAVDKKVTILVFEIGFAEPKANDAAHLLHGASRMNQIRVFKFGQLGPVS
jgi:hypothetical protein